MRKIQTLRVNNSRIPRTTNAKFSEYHFYLNANIYRDFQVCISVPLNIRLNFSVVLIQMKKYAKLENITMRLMRRAKVRHFGNLYCLFFAEKKYYSWYELMLLSRLLQISNIAFLGFVNSFACWWMGFY